MPSELAYEIGLARITKAALGRRAPGSLGHDQSRKEAFFTIERRRVIVPLVNRHKAILLEKLPGLNLKELVASIHIIFRNSFNNLVTPGKAEWYDRDTMIFKNQATMESLLARLRKDIRQLAIINVNKENRSRPEIELDVSSSLLLGGIDPRFEAHGGDVRRTDLAKGILITGGSPKSELAMGNTRLSNVAKKHGTGFEAGHAFGPGISGVISITGTKDKPSEIITLFSPDVQAQFIRFREVAIKIDASMRIRTNLLSKTGKVAGTITIFFAEKAGDNAASGRKLGKEVITPFQKILKLEEPIIRAEFKKLLDTYKDSPTIINQYRLLIEELFLTGKVKRKRKDNTYKTTVTLKLKIPEYGPRLTTTPVRQRVKPKGNTQNLNELIVFLNSKLTNKIRQNMGKGNSKQKLNWRTGDFARSAKIRALIPSRDRNTIMAKVDYWGFPRYHRFEKGGDLHKPLRDPAGIFGRSIRQILQEERIISLKRVKVTLRGK